jgi:hypothetical protein
MDVSDISGLPGHPREVHPRHSKPERLARFWSEALDCRDHYINAQIRHPAAPAHVGPGIAAR